MLDIDKIKAIKRHIRESNPKARLPYTIESIRAACLEHLDIDALDIHGLDLENSPIKGRYVRHEYQAGVYQDGPRTKISVIVCVKENYCWQRYISCKEMCQAIFDNTDEQVSTTEELEKLIKGLVLPENAKQLAASTDEPLGTEILSEHIALEILCPVEDRKRLLENFQTQKTTAQEIAAAYRIPAKKVAELFDLKTINFMDSLFGISE